MIGREVLETNAYLSLDELEQFMKDHWNTEEYGPFTRGRPTAASVEEYICLPATDRFMVIVFGRAKGGLFSKKDKIVLSVCNTPESMLEQFAISVKTRSAITGAIKMKRIRSMEDERKGPAQEVLLLYTAYMKSLLDKEGLLK